MAGKKKHASQSDTGAGSPGQCVQNPVEQSSPYNQATGGYDPEDYHGSGPIPVGHAPVHDMEQHSAGIPIGVDVDEIPEGNPRPVRQTDSLPGEIIQETLGNNVRPDEILRKASKTTHDE